MSGKIVVTTCEISFDGEIVNAKCSHKQVSQQQLNQYAEQLKNYLLRIDYTKIHSYDNSDDDRVEDSYSRWDSCKYCEIEPMENAQHLVVDGNMVIGVVFLVTDNSQRTETHVFLFDDTVQEKMYLGYSASHSEDWTCVNNVTIVRRGKNGVPQTGSAVNFKQSQMYPSI